MTQQIAQAHGAHDGAAGRAVEPVELRYGVFLRPDPVTCAALSSVVTLLRHQFGLRSAAAFPPHVTILGSVAISAPPEELLKLIDPVLSGAGPIPIRNRGLAVVDGALVLDVGAGSDDGPRSDLHALRDELITVVRPLARATSDTLTAPWDTPHFRPHLSLANHEVRQEPHRLDEVHDFVRGLDVSFPAQFTGEVFALVELSAPTFEGAWWESMTWRHLHSWTRRPADA